MATTAAVFVADKPVDGVQAYEVAPLAVSVELNPFCIVMLVGNKDIVGIVLMAAVTTLLLTDVPPDEATLR